MQRNIVQFILGLFSTYAKLFEKLTFFTPDINCLFFGKFCGQFCVRTKWIIYFQYPHSNVRKAAVSGGCRLCAVMCKSLQRNTNTGAPDLFFVGELKLIVLLPFSQ